MLIFVTYPVTAVSGRYGLFFVEPSMPWMGPGAAEAELVQRHKKRFQPTP